MRRRQIILKIGRLANAIEALELDGHVKDHSPEELEALKLLKEDRGRLIEELKLHSVDKK